MSYGCECYEIPSYRLALHWREKARRETPMTCAYCHESTSTVRLRLIPNAERETVYLCRECWQDVQTMTTPRRAET